MLVRFKSILVLFNPSIEIAAMEVNPSSLPNHRQFLLENEVLNRLLRAAQVNGRLFHIQQDRPHLYRRKPSQFHFQKRHNFSCQSLRQTAHRGITGTLYR